MTSKFICGVLFGGVLLLPACGDDAANPAGECTPACEAGEFCCLGTCQAVGTVCGDSTGGAPAGGAGGAGGAVAGGGGAGGAPDPCALHDGATSVVTACAADGSVTYCQQGESDTCNPGYVCVEWVDPETHVLDAYCPMMGETEICDPDVDHGTCQGNSAHPCLGVVGPNSPPTSPGHYETFDCVALNGAGSTCSIDAATLQPYCTVP
ncbi:MAG: hypothetical protein U0271_09680 [Polyangiaceae bacterium]